MVVSDDAGTARSKADEIKVLFDVIKNKRNFHHNEKVLKEGDGNLILVRKPTNHIDQSAYGPCPECLRYYACAWSWNI